MNVPQDDLGYRLMRVGCYGSVISTVKPGERSPPALPSSAIRSRASRPDAGVFAAGAVILAERRGNSNQMGGFVAEGIWAGRFVDSGGMPAARAWPSEAGGLSAASCWLGVENTEK